MQIITPRLLLREIRGSDLDALFALYSDPVYQRYEGLPKSREAVREVLDGYLATQQADPRKKYALAITLPPDDTLIGKITLQENYAAIREWEMGWGVAPACWGQGYAPEAARALLRFAFEELKVHRVMAFCHADNHASRRVMEKIGMKQEGRLRQVRWLNEQWWDEYVYAVLEEDTHVSR